MKETNISAIMKFLIICPGIVTLGVFTQIVTLSFKQERLCFRRVMMRYKVLIGISLISVFTNGCGSIGISSKLDFGESQSSPKIIGTATQYRSAAPIPYQYFKQENTKTSGDFEDLGVVCLGGGCNTTSTKANESADSIQTDVIVHVKTSVDVNKNKTKVVEDVPDVPVIVGTAGTNTEQSQSRSFHQRPLVVTNIDDAFPSIGSSLSSVTPTFIPSYPSYSTPSLVADSIYKSNLPAEPHVDINIKTLPAVSLTMTDDGRSIKDIRYKSNGLEVRVPYFEPSYHNHYFGENPPPQYIYYQKSPGLFNPGEYKPKATWKPSFWSSGQPHKHTGGSPQTCSCNNPAINTGLQWHPSRRVYNVDPGSQIDDKLAPLN